MICGSQPWFADITGIAEGAIAFGKMGLVLVSYMQPLFYVGLVAAAVQLGYGIDKLVVKDQSRCAAVFQNKFKFVCHKRQFKGTTTAPIFANA